MNERLEKIDRYKNCIIIELCGIEDFYKLFDSIDDEEIYKIAVYKSVIKAQRHRLKKIFKFMRKIDRLTFSP